MGSRPMKREKTTHRMIINNYSPKVNIVEYYSTMFTSPSANNRFSIISELKDRENDISDISSSETWANRLTAILF